MRKDLEEVLKLQLEKALPDYKLYITEDINYWLDKNDFDINDILIVINQGNATRSEVGKVTFFNSSAMLQIYCSLMNKEDVISKLDILFNEMSKQKQTYSTKKYTYAFNFNTAASDGIARVFSGIDVAYVQGICSVTSFEKITFTDMPSSIHFERERNDGTHKIIISSENIISFNAQSNCQTDDVNVMGNRFIKRFENLDVVNYNVSLILDEKTKDFENMAMKYADPLGGYFSNKVLCEIFSLTLTGKSSTNKFESFLTVGVTYNIGNFSVIDLIIAR